MCYITVMHSAYPGGTVGMNYSNRLNSSPVKLAVQEPTSGGTKCRDGREEEGTNEL